MRDDYVNSVGFHLLDLWRLTPLESSFRIYNRVLKTVLATNSPWRIDELWQTWGYYWHIFIFSLCIFVILFSTTYFLTSFSCCLWCFAFQLSLLFSMKFALTGTTLTLPAHKIEYTIVSHLQILQRVEICCLFVYIRWGGYFPAPSRQLLTNKCQTDLSTSGCISFHSLINGTQEERYSKH